MYPDVLDLDRRLSDLQSQIDRLTLSLHLWREQLEQQTGARMQNLERTAEQEWSALRRLHEEPVKLLREQAASLTEVSVATAATAATGFDRAEARLAVLETNIRQELTNLSDQVQSAVAELRTLTGQPPRPAAPSTASWPLEGVVRLHNQLRAGADAPAPDALMPVAAPRPELPEAAAALAERLETLERAVNDGQAESRQAAERGGRLARFWWAAAVVVAVLLTAFALLVSRLQQQVGTATARVSEAQRQAQAASETAARQIAAAHENAARQVAEAQDTAQKAQTISDVLAAPDLVRYSLVSSDPSIGSTAQALWSRSRGFVFSGSRLPQPPAGSTYQIWLLTSSDPVSAGLFTPDAAGRFTLATGTPPAVPRPMIGVSVTLEPEGGGPKPAGAIVLARAQSR